MTNRNPNIVCLPTFDIAVIVPTYRATKIDGLRNEFYSSLTSLNVAEMLYRNACRALADANRTDDWECRGTPQREAMADINHYRASLRRAEASCLKARNALRLWPGAADRILSAVNNSRGN